MTLIDARGRDKGRHGLVGSGIRPVAGEEGIW